MTLRREDLEAILLGKGKGPKEVFEESADYPLFEAVVAELKTRFLDYSQPCKFKPGDLVTPRPGGGALKIMLGRPMIVLEVRVAGPFMPPVRNITETSSNEFGKRMNMRVLYYSTAAECYVAFWVESFEFIAWDGGSDAQSS